MKLLCLATMVVVLGGCSRPPEIRLVDDAAEAMGGRDKIRAVKTVTIAGEGSDRNLGQNVTPEGELPVWKVTDFVWVIDPGNGRMRQKQTRTAQFLFAGATVQHQETGLDGDLAYNLSASGAAVRASAAAVKDRRLEMLRYPLTVVRAAFDPGARLSHFRQYHRLDIADIVTAQGDRLTLAVDSSTHLPYSVTTMTDQPNLGDVAVETTFTDYQESSGLLLPRHLATKVDRYPQLDLTVRENVVDAEGVTLEAPAGVKQAHEPAPAPVNVTAQEVEKGVWWLAGSGNHHSVLFEFSDHLALFEVPLNEARSKAVIDKARALVPGKPLTLAIVSHHHFDHSGGLRTAVAEGLTIVTYKGNVDFFQDLVSRKHSIAPDELARNPKPLKIVPVDDELTLKDSAMEVQLYHVKDNPREGTLLFAYAPRGRLLVQADLYDSTWLQFPWADNFLWNPRMRGLRWDKDVPVHGAIQSYAEVLKTLQAKHALKDPAFRQ